MRNLSEVEIMTSREVQSMALRLKETRQATPEEHEQFMQNQADFDWLAAHAKEIEREHRGKYIAVVNQEFGHGSQAE